MNLSIIPIQQAKDLYLYSGIVAQGYRVFDGEIERDPLAQQALTELAVYVNKSGKVVKA